MEKLNGKISTPLPKQIKEKILKNIKEEKIKPGEKVLSEEELAKKFEVSRMTVREAIIELINEKILFRVHGKGTFLSEDFDKGNSSEKMIVIELPNLRNSFYYQIVSGAEKIFSQNDYSFTIFSERDNPVEEKKYFEKILNGKMSGFFLISTYYTHTNLSILKKIQKKIPVIVVDVKIPELKVDTVISNDFKGGFMITEHLIELGHKKILHLSGPVDDSSANERKNGYIEALKKYGITQSIIRTTGWELENGYYETKKFFLNNNEVKAVFACNDEVALGAYRAIKELQIKIPDEIVLTGYGNLDIGRVLEIPFTTVDQSPEKMGEIAAKLLIDKIEGRSKLEKAEEIKVDTKLVIRNSCGIYQKKGK
ncbi:MAG: GntR family transcriptional regulator [Candidatus Omnitrophica bacterium]|nr:GntR family transcriptional regulator [Candidatus Omnitrophota bacterium]